MSRWSGNARKAWYFFQVNNQSQDINARLELGRHLVFRFQVRVISKQKSKYWDILSLIPLHKWTRVYMKCVWSKKSRVFLRLYGVINVASDRWKMELNFESSTVFTNYAWNTLMAFLSGLRHSFMYFASFWWKINSILTYWTESFCVY